MMRLVSVAAVLAACVLSPSASPDERPPYPYVVASSTGEYYFKMVPDAEHAGRGTAYQVSASGADVELWSVSGWYSAATHLSSDGRYLVCVGSSEGKSLIDFYAAGKLVSQYTPADLVDNPHALDFVSHGSWVIKPWPQFVGGNRFQIVTRESVEYTFDYRSGEILSKRRL